MAKKTILKTCLSIWPLVLALACFSSSAQPPVTVVGQMRNVMWKGQLQGTISLDTIANKQHLFGLGPVDYLAGELLILDGTAYKSTVLTDSEMQVEEAHQAKAPFFAFANIPRWKEKGLPGHIQTIAQLESYLDRLTKTSARPFLFRLTGIVESATIHVVNLPKGAAVSSPEDAHVGKTNYPITNERSEILGFFSKEHQAIFTHHDTFLHMHLITADRKKMGHLDEVRFKKGSMRLFLPLK